jgi:hypothetical protein
MSESAKNQMNARSKANRLAKANVEPCDNAGVDFLPFPYFVLIRGCPKMTIYSVKTLDRSVGLCSAGFFLYAVIFGCNAQANTLSNRLLALTIF